MAELNGAKILIVEDDNDICEIISLYLRKEGCVPTIAGCGRQALEFFRREGPDLVLLDVTLPDMTGMEFCRTIRESSAVPILFVSYHKDADYILNGLDAGGDDYVTKPFDPHILLARIKALLRRVARSEMHTVDLPGLQIDFSGCIVRANGEIVNLPAKELQLLLYLAKHPNRVFSVAELYERIWGWEKESGEWTVIVHISNLRKKIETDPANPTYIKTVRGFGYKFEMKRQN
ncbi:MAG TPA: response regulator transcription factor [Bacilli bacterium]